MKTLEEKNRMIAEFMDIKFKDDDTYIKELKDMKRNGIYFEQGYMTSELKYHYSWDWLMPVVNVIESILDDSQSNDIVGYHLYDVEIKQDVCIIHGANIECSFADKLTNTYEAVVEFIEFYNKNK